MFLIIILFFAWAWMIYYLGTAPFGEGQTHSWIELFEGNEKKYERLLDKQKLYLGATRAIQFAGLYILLYLIINGGSLHWATFRAWVAFLLTLGVVFADEKHQAVRQKRKPLRTNLMHSGLGAAYAHILLGVLNAIF